MKQLNENTAIVSSKELGFCCWLVIRFLKLRRCPRVFRCNYPCKKTCRAVDAELEYLHQEMERQVAFLANKEAQLLRERLK